MMDEQTVKIQRLIYRARQIQKAVDLLIQDAAAMLPDRPKRTADVKLIDPRNGKEYPACKRSESCPKKRR